MNKISSSQNHILIRAFALFILCVLIGFPPLQIAKANAAPPPDPTVGGVVPYQPQKTNVQMMSETVFIDVSKSPSDIQEPKQIRVNAQFTMRNQGQTEEKMQVIFPLTRLGYGQQALYEIDISSFAVKVDGQPITITETTTPAELINYAPVQWAAFEVTFPVQQEVVLQVDYEMLNPYGKDGEGFTGVAYILETGAGWYGNILSADITLRLPYEVTEEVIKYANPGYVISNNEMQWKLQNFEPTREDNLEVRVFHADVWQVVLDLRERVEQYPEDADAWAQLADLYQQFSIFLHFYDGNSPIYDINHHFADLTLEARQKVVALRPEWGNAHFRLAEILWYTNPIVEEKFSTWVYKKGFIQPDDPSIQEALDELDLAWSYGFNGNVDARVVDQFQRRINNAVPGLELTSPATATIASPTETLVPTATITALPTTLPTLITTVSPIPLQTKASSPIPYGILIAAATFSLVIIAGIFGYRLKSRGE